MARPRLIALQTAVVGVLLVVVYLTILRPSGHGDVSGVQAPGAGQRTSGSPPPGAQRGHRRPGRDRSRHRRTAISRAGAPPTVAIPVRASAPAAVPAGHLAPSEEQAHGSSPPSVGGSPSDDQYGGTLERLHAALR
jgi:hypothetical protein